MGPSASGGHLVDAARLIDQVVDYAIISLDPDGRITSWNAGATRLKGYSALEAVGCHFSMLYAPADRDDDLPARLLAQARERGAVEHSGWRVRRDGSRFWGNVVITALHDDRGRLIGFAKVTRDLTSRKQVDDARERFFDTFAHDFRTPVTAIAGFAEMLPTAPPDVRDSLVERIKVNAARLVDMTALLSGHSHLRSGAEGLTLERLGLDDLVRTTLDGLDLAEDTARVESLGTDLHVLGDRGALERVLTNLITNALHYSAADTPVRVVAASTDSHVVLSVVDRGRGIDPDDLPTIFDEFERGRLAVDDGGTGLGLTSVKLLVEAMDGTVTIESEPGVGTTVALTLARA